MKILHLIEYIVDIFAVINFAVTAIISLVILCRQYLHENFDKAISKAFS